MMKLELVKSEYDYVNNLLSSQIDKLKSMTSEQRMEWYNNSLFNNHIKTENLSRILKANGKYLKIRILRLSVKKILILFRN